MIMDTCSRCDAKIDISWKYCPHCGTGFPYSVPSDDLVEKLATLIHFQWSHWMKHLFSRTMTIDHQGPRIRPEDEKKWKRQMKTPYKELSEEEKESDREWARKMLNTVRTGRVHYTKVAADAPRPTFKNVKHGDKVEWKGSTVHVDMSSMPHEVSLVDSIPKPMRSYEMSEKEIEELKRDVAKTREKQFCENCGGELDPGQYEPTWCDDCVSGVFP